MNTRDVRLDTNQLLYAKKVCAKRRRELEKRLEKSTYEGKPGMLKGVLDELDTYRELERVFEHNFRAARDEWIERCGLNK